MEECSNIIWDFLTKLHYFSFVYLEEVRYIIFDIIRKQMECIWMQILLIMISSFNIRKCTYYKYKCICDKLFLDLNKL